MVKRYHLPPVHHAGIKLDTQSPNPKNASTSSNRNIKNEFYLKFLGW
jgi:hypothetical protein